MKVCQWGVFSVQERHGQVSVGVLHLSDVASARQIGTLLVERQLAACINLLPAVESIYRWQGNVETAAEVLAIFKTAAVTFPAFQRALSDVHPYKVPEIIASAPQVSGPY